MPRLDASSGDIDPALALLAADPRSTVRRPPPHVPLERVRAAADAAMLHQPPGPPVHSVEALSAPGPLGEIPLRLYRPNSAADLPLIIFLHGGGFTFGSLDTHDPLCRSLARASESAVLSVGYRLAPEHPFPAPVNDCLAACKWAVGLASKLGLRHDCWALAGDSAGANLALSTALRLRGGANVPSALGLFYPLIDPTCNTASTHQYASGPVLSRDAMIWFWENYLGAERAQVDAAVLASDLSQLPPTSILIASADPLRDEGRALAERLRTFRVDVKLREYPGMVHGFLGLGQLTSMANKAMSDIAQDLSIQLNPCKPVG